MSDWFAWPDECVEAAARRLAAEDDMEYDSFRQAYVETATRLLDAATAALPERTQRILALAALSDEARREHVAEVLQGLSSPLQWAKEDPEYQDVYRERAARILAALLADHPQREDHHGPER
jgi:hypothetical protein